MTARRLFGSVSVLLIVLVAAMPLYAAKPKPKPRVAPKIDLKAVQLLRQMNDYMSGLQAFSVHVNTARDLMLPNDQALTSDLSYDLMVRRPDRMRVNMTSAARSAQVFYDGKSITIFTPEKNFYATRPAPPTIAEAIQDAMKRGVSMPLAEFLSRDPGQVLSRVTSATYVGSSMLGGTMTNQLAFRQKGMDWQIWIEDSPTPLPRRIMIVDRSVKDFPRFVATLSNWNTSPTFDESVFTFVAPAGAQQIPIGQVPKLPRSYRRPAPTR